MVLPMAVPAAVIMTTALLEDDDLLALLLRDDLGRDSQALDRAQVGTFAGEQNVAQADRRPCVALDLLDDDLVSGGDALLLAARAHYCEHRSYHFPKALRPREVARRVKRGS